MLQNSEFLSSSTAAVCSEDSQTTFQTDHRNHASDGDSQLHRRLFKGMWGGTGCALAELQGCSEGRTAAMTVGCAGPGREDCEAHEETASLTGNSSHIDSFRVA